MSEASSRSNLIKKLKPLDAFAIESPSTGLGIPDVGCVCGFIECKWMKAWPKSCDTRPVRFPHPLSKEQHIWLWRHCKQGGQALLCCQVAQEWFFFDGRVVKEEKLWDNMTRLEMREKALIHFQKGLQAAELIEFLKTRLRTLVMRNDF